MSEPRFEATYTLSEAEFLSATAHFARRVWTRVFVVVAVLFVWSTALEIWSDGWDWIAIVASMMEWLLFGAIFFLAANLYNRWFLRRRFREEGDLASECKISLFDDLFTIEHVHGIYRYAWADIWEWDYGSENLLIFPKRAIFFVVLERAVGKEAIAFAIERMKATGLTKANLKRRK